MSDEFQTLFSDIEDHIIRNNGNIEDYYKQMTNIFIGKAKFSTFYHLIIGEHVKSQKLKEQLNKFNQKMLNDNDCKRIHNNFKLSFKMLANKAQHYRNIYNVILSLYLSGLITPEYYCEQLSKLLEAAENPRSVIQQVNEQLADITTLTRPEIISYISWLSVDTPMTLTFIWNPLYEPPPGIRFYTIISLSVGNKIDILNSIIRCCHLFGVDLINRETALAWLNNIFPPIVGKFTEFINENDPKFLTFSYIQPHMSHFIVSNKINAIFQEPLVNYLTGNYADLMGIDPNEDIVSFYQRPVFPSPFFVSTNLNAARFYQMMKTISIYLREGTHESVESMKAISNRLFNTTMFITPALANVMMKRIRKMGSIENMLNISEIESILDTIDTCNPTYRFVYKCYLNRSRVKRGIVLGGLKEEVPVMDDVVMGINILKGMLLQLDAYDGMEAVLKFVQKRNSGFVSESFALSIFYFLEFLKCNPNDCKNLQSIVLTKTPPYDLHGRLSAFDLLFARIARSAAKVKEPFVRDHPHPEWGGLFSYYVSYKDNSILIDAIPNPIL